MLTRALHLAAGTGLLLWIVPAALADEPSKTKDDAEASAKAEPDGKKAEIAWAKSFSDALERARKDKKLVMVDFYTEWCGWCKKLDADTYTDPKVVRTSEKFVPVKVDAEDEKGGGKDVAVKYKVEGFPTILFLDPSAETNDGAIEGRIGGYMPPGPFAEQMDLVARAHEEFPKLRDRLKEAPDDLEALGKLAVIHHLRQANDRASALLDRGLKQDPENAKGLLTKALNAVADQHQEAEDFDKAIPLFRKAARTAKDPSDAAYALSSIAVCLLSQEKVEDAIPELEAVAKIPGVSAEDKEQAADLLERIREARAEKAARKKAADRDEDPKPEEK